MKLEEAIKQTKFSSEQQKAFLNLVYLASLIKARQARLFKQYDLSPEQYNILRILRGQKGEPATIGLLQERMLDRMSNASRLVEKLKQKKLIIRRECPTDRRQVDVLLSNDGAAILKEIDPIIKQSEKNFGGLTEKELQTLNKLLDKISDSLDEQEN